MADFLSRLAERTLGIAEGARPRIAPLFAADASPAQSEPLELGDELPRAIPPPSPPRDDMARRALVEAIHDHAMIPAAPAPAAAETARPPRARDRDDTRPLAASERPAPSREVSSAATDQVARPGQPGAQPAPLATRQPVPGRTDRDPVAPADRGRDDDAPLVPSPPVARRPSMGEGERHAALSDPLGDARREEPAVSVTIGRVEVRAVFPSPPPARPAPRPAPQLTLEEYVRQRREGLR